VLVRVGDDGVLLGPIDGRALIYAAYHDASVSGTNSNAGLAPFMIRKGKTASSYLIVIGIRPKTISNRKNFNHFDLFEGIKKEVRFIPK
jgi:hypothetical protein